MNNIILRGNSKSKRLNPTYQISLASLYEAIVRFNLLTGNLGIAWVVHCCKSAGFAYIWMFCMQMNLIINKIYEEFTTDIYFTFGDMMLAFSMCGCCKD